MNGKITVSIMIKSVSFLDGTDQYSKGRGGEHKGNAPGLVCVWEPSIHWYYYCCTVVVETGTTLVWACVCSARRRRRWRNDDGLINRWESRRRWDSGTSTWLLLDSRHLVIAEYKQTAVQKSTTAESDFQWNNNNNLPPPDDCLIIFSTYNILNTVYEIII